MNLKNVVVNFGGRLLIRAAGLTTTAVKRCKTIDGEVEFSHSLPYR